MELILHDATSVLRPLYTQPFKAAELQQLAQGTVLGEGGLYSRLEPAFKGRESGGYGVMAAAQQDGFDLMMFQQAWGLFNPARKVEASGWAFEQFAALDLPETAQLWLCEFRLNFNPAHLPPRLDLLMLPADPGNQTLMAMNHGVSGFGGVPGYVLLELWPSKGNRDRLGPVLARLFVHNVRQGLQPGHTLADLLVREGLAAAFVAQTFPTLAAPWLTPFAKPADWDAALAHVASFYGVASYDDVQVNIYGMRRAVGPDRPPAALPLGADELAYARALIGTALGETDARLQAAYLYGDELVSRQGHPTVGMLPYGGFEVAYREVQAYLQRSGRSLRETVALPAAEILRGWAR